MKITILTLGVALWLGQVFPAAGGEDEDPDMTAIMIQNSKTSGTGARMNKWVLVTQGGPVTGYMFAKETSNSDTLHVTIGGALNSNKPLSNDSWGKYYYFGDFADNLLVEFKMTERDNNTELFNYDTASDGWCHVMIQGFCGYDKGGKHIPPGLWLGWEDWADPICDPLCSDYDFNDLCFVLTGCIAKAITKKPDGNGDTVLLKTNCIDIGNRITGWKEENLY